MKKRALCTAMVLLLVVGGLLLTSCNPDMGVTPGPAEKYWMTVGVAAVLDAEIYYMNGSDVIVAGNIPGMSVRISGSTVIETYTNLDLALVTNDPAFVGHTLSGKATGSNTYKGYIFTLDITLSGSNFPENGYSMEIKANTTTGQISKAVINGVKINHSLITFADINPQS